jgi:hypothetical protein
MKDLRCALGLHAYVKKQIEESSTWSAAGAARTSPPTYTSRPEADSAQASQPASVAAFPGEPQRRSGRRYEDGRTRATHHRPNSPPRRDDGTTHPRLPSERHNMPR